MEVQLREYQNQDFEQLKHVIRETWNYDAFSSPKAASKLADVFLSSCLTNDTFSRVAELDGNAVGIIIVKDIRAHQCPLSRRLKQVKSILSLFMSGEGRRAWKIFGNVSDIDRQLLHESGRSYPAELALFAVRSSCRGKGVGKKLYQSALDYMKRQGLDEFYLFTDTSCNYGFYEHQGMERRCEKEHIFNMDGQTAKMNFFIYDYRFTRCQSGSRP